MRSNSKINQGKYNMTKSNKIDKKKNLTNERIKLCPDLCPKINVFYKNNGTYPDKQNKNPYTISNEKRKVQINSAPLTLFKSCMHYYCEKLDKKSPYIININDIHNLGQIYYILKFRLYEDVCMENSKNIFVRKKNEFIEYLFENKRVCENLFINDNNEPRFTQFIKEFSQKINIESQDVIMKSINEENKICNDEENKISIDDELLTKFFNLNKINKDKINDYQIILILKGKIVDVKEDNNFKNLLNFSNNLRIFDSSQNKQKKSTYYIQLFCEEEELNIMKLENDEDYSNVKDEDFECLMNQIKDNKEGAIFAFLYEPLKYFNNYGQYILNPNKFESIIYINSSIKDIQLLEIFNAIKK